MEQQVNNINNPEDDGFQSGNMYCYNPRNSNSINDPPKESDQQNAIRRSTDERNANIGLQNNEEKSSEQRIDKIKDSSSPFQINPTNVFHPKREPKNNYTEVHYVHLDGMPESFLVSERVECIKVLLWQLAQEELKR